MCLYVYITGQYAWSGRRGNTHPDPDPDLEIQNKSTNFVPDPFIPDQRKQHLKINAALDVRSMPCSIPVPEQNKAFSTCSPHITCGDQQSQSSFQTLRIKWAIQTRRMRQHRNVHPGHVVLSSSHIYIYTHIYTHTCVYIYICIYIYMCTLGAVQICACEKKTLPTHI